MMPVAHILILFAHVGLLGDGNSNALSIQEFSSKENCVVAGKAAVQLADGSVKKIEFACVKK